MKVIVIGGGPAGMMAAITAARQGNKVILLEKNSSLGKKLLITGKGRCNITSSLEMEEFIPNIPGNGKFLYSVFQNFTNTAIINMMERNGLEVKKERGNRIFPVTDKALDVLHVFENELKRANVEIKFNSKASKILINEEKINGVEINSKEILNCDKVVLATGGKSYPFTGSSGEGYTLAQKVGHSIEKIEGSIVPLEADKKMCQMMQGLSLKNVKIQIKDSDEKEYEITPQHHVAILCKVSAIGN